MLKTDLPAQFSIHRIHLEQINSEYFKTPRQENFPKVPEKKRQKGAKNEVASWLAEAS